MQRGRQIPKLLDFEMGKTLPGQRVAHVAIEAGYQAVRP